MNSRRVKSVFRNSRVFCKPQKARFRSCCAFSHIQGVFRGRMIAMRLHRVQRVKRARGDLCWWCGGCAVTFGQPRAPPATHQPHTSRSLFANVRHPADNKIIPYSLVLLHCGHVAPVLAFCAPKTHHRPAALASPIHGFKKVGRQPFFILRRTSSF